MTVSAPQLSIDKKYRRRRHFGISKATRAGLREAARTPGFGLLDTLHCYIYGRWPYLFIGVGLGEHFLVRLMRPVMNVLFNALSRFPADNIRIETSGPRPGKLQKHPFLRKETFADTYHGKVLRLPGAKKLVTVEKAISLTGLEKVIPFKTAQDIILKRPERILAFHCPCRSVRVNPCFPLDVCLIIGEPFVSFVAEHHVDRSRLISSGEACSILEAEAQRGHVHHAFFKEAAFGRFFAICNCCQCCCGAMQAQRNGIPMLASSGYATIVNQLKCKACGTCIEKCPFNAIQLAGSIIEIDPQLCMGCGVCAGFCPEGALSLKRDYTRSDPLEIDQLL